MVEELTVAAVFARSPQAFAVYRRLAEAVDDFGGVRVEPKQTCVHLAAGRSAFAGVHPRKDGVLVTIRTSRPIDSPRVRKQEQASTNRCHNDLVLTSPEEVDAELVSWLRQGHAISLG